MKPLSEQRWIVINSHRGVPCVTGAGQDDGLHICRVDGRVTAETNQERALLIAAAPELLAACKAYYHGQKEARECEAMMGAAIAKAEGRAL